VSWASHLFALVSGGEIPAQEARDFEPHGPSTNYTFDVIERNFDPVSAQPSGYVNGELYSYYIYAAGLSPPPTSVFCEAIPVLVDPSMSGLPFVPAATAPSAPGVREKDPFRPSTKLSALTMAEQTTVARQRQEEAPKLIHLVRGDLDWIVMKCMEKDRTRRYETANGLARDVERHLNNEPVVASPPGKLYRFQRLVCPTRLPAQPRRYTFCRGLFHQLNARSR
jgi:hypothetical protein